MENMSSADFRKTYAKLRKPVYVTVNGHVIGHWIPANGATYVAAILKEGTDEEAHEVHGLAPPPGARTREPVPGRDPMYNSRPFTPVPKKK